MDLTFLDLNRLVAIRKAITYELRFVGLLFPVSLYSIYWMFATDDDAPDSFIALDIVPSDPSLLPEPVYCILILLLVMAWNGYISRLLYVFVTASFSILMLILVIMVASRELQEWQGLNTNTVLFFSALVLYMFGCWRLVTRHSLCLLLTIMPLGKCKPYYHQAKMIVKLKRKEKCKRSQLSIPEPGSRKRGFSTLVPAFSFLVSGLIALWVAIVGLYSWNGTWQGYFWVGIYVAIFYLGTGLFSTLVVTWQEKNMPKPFGRLSDKIGPDDILLLRSFRDDRQRFYRRRLPLSYDWHYTFEELIVERMRILGQTYCAGNPEEYCVPKGARRIYGDKSCWQSDILSAMKTARVIIVVMGASYNLMWEIQEVKKRAYLMKTIFILPSFLGRKMAQQSWKEFIDYYCVSNECREKCNAVNANNVLGIGFLSPREPIIFCANKTNKLYYETLASSQSQSQSQSGKMVRC